MSDSLVARQIDPSKMMTMIRPGELACFDEEQRKLIFEMVIRQQQNEKRHCGAHPSSFFFNDYNHNFFLFLFFLFLFLLFFLFFFLFSFFLPFFLPLDLSGQGRQLDGGAGVCRGQAVQAKDLQPQTPRLGSMHGQDSQSQPEAGAR